MIQLIIFLSGNEEFGIPISEVREIIKIGQITPIPNTPHFIKGIINVRGEIVTAIDVKTRFSLSSSITVDPKHIVVTKQEDGLFGLIVDEVIEVLRIQGDEIKPPPSIIKKIHKKYINGVITHNKRLIILLDLKQVLAHTEIMKVDHSDKKKKQSINYNIKDDANHPTSKNE